MEDLYVMPEFRGEINDFKSEIQLCIFRAKHQVLNNICLSGNGIGKALMSKVAQVSKASCWYKQPT